MTDSAPAPPLRGALIGCGFVSRFHLQAWPLVEGARIVALCDLDPGRLRAAQGLAPGAGAYERIEDLFAAERPDFVEICTRPDSHPSLTGLAARNGAHVLCQKPAAGSREALLAMIADCDRAGVRLMIHENWRFRPWYRALRAEILAGTVGVPIRLRLSHRETRALLPGGFGEQPYFAEMPRLILFEMGPHLVDTARFLLGQVVEVFAALGRFGPGHPGEDLATLSIRFASGALGLLDMSWCAPADIARPEWAINESVIEGTESTLRLRTDGRLQLVRPDGATEVRPVPLPSEPSVYLSGYAACQAHFLAGLRDGSSHETSGEETLKTMDVIWAGYRSAEERRAIVPTS